MKELLQERTREDQRCGWKLKKKVKWPIVQLFARKLRHIFDVWMKTEEKLLKVEYRKPSFGAGQIVHNCEPKQGAMLREDDEEDDRPIESLKKSLESVVQHGEEMLMSEASRETEESHGFQTNCLCVIVGTEEERQHLDATPKHILMKS